MTTVPARTLDWVPRYDEQSREYPAIRAALPLRSMTWKGAPHLDQGSEGACVGFGWVHGVSARPISVQGLTYTHAMNVYYRAQQLDIWPGENYSGTSVLAGAKAVRKQGWITEFRWNFSLQEVLQTLSHIGPVILGCNWHAGMYAPGASGYIRPTGGVLGGHCVMLRGISTYYERVVVHNSWGSDWGLGGNAFLTWADLNTLIKQGAEMCVPVKR